MCISILQVNAQFQRIYNSAAAYIILVTDILSFIKIMDLCANYVTCNKYIINM